MTQFITQRDYDPNENNQQDNEDPGWFERQKAELERYVEDKRLAEQGTSREQIASEAVAAKAQKAEEEKAIVEQQMKQKFDQLPVGQREIYSQYAAEMDKALEAERAKSDLQLQADELDRELNTLAAQLEPMLKSPTKYGETYDTLSAQLTEKWKRREMLELEINPPGLPDSYLNAHGARRTSE